MLCPIIFNSNTIELLVIVVLDLLCVTSVSKGYQLSSTEVFLQLVQENKILCYFHASA